MITIAARYRRIYWTSRILRWLILGSMLALAVTAIHPFVSQTADWAVSPKLITRMAPIAGSTPDARLAAWLSVLPKLVLLYGFYRLVQMLRSCERGELFSAQAAAHLQLFSTSIVVFELLRISLPAQIDIAHVTTGQVHGLIKLVITSDQMWLLQLALLFMLLASLMREAAKIAEDNAKII